MKTISLKLPEELLARLKSECKARGLRQSSLIRECLERELKSSFGPDGPSCYDLAKDLHGIFKGAPKDLAENPKYMEGFGE